MYAQMYILKLYMECFGANLAVDAFLHSVSENQHIKGLIQHPHHHGLRVQRATVLWSTEKKRLLYTDKMI